MARKKLTDHVSRKDAVKDVTDAGAVLGGILGARFINRQLDKVINPVVQGFSGLTGIQMSPDTAKYVKPAIITSGGIVTHQIGRGKKSSITEKFGLGMAATGIADFASVFTDKPILNGLGSTDNADAEIDAEEEIQIIDTETGEPIVPGAAEEDLELPELSGADEEFDLQGEHDNREFDLQGNHDEYFETEYELQ